MFLFFFALPILIGEVPKSGGGRKTAMKTKSPTGTPETRDSDTRASESRCGLAPLRMELKNLVSQCRECGSD